MIERIERIVLRVLIPSVGLVGVVWESINHHPVVSEPLLIAYLAMMGLSVPAIKNYVSSGKPKNGGKNES